jgi:DnaK suppressor protein
MAKVSKRSTAVAVESQGARYEELRKILEDRQRDILSEVQGRIRGVRAEGSEKPHEVMDPGETSEVDIQEDIEFALIQMKAETLNKINEALSRLEEGTYGRCFECAEEIAEPRLRALPFAVRSPAARHRAVPELLHAAGRGARKLRAPDRRGHRRRAS